MNRIGIGAVATLVFAATAGIADDAKWQLASSTDAASYQLVSSLSQVSKNSISDEYAVKEVNPRLEFYCTPGGDNTIRMRIDWQRFISSFNTEVSFAVEGAEPLTLKLGVDRTNKITLSKNAEDVAALVATLAGNGTLTVNVTPYSEAPVAVNFAIEGFSAAFEGLEASCSL